MAARLLMAPLIEKTDCEETKDAKPGKVRSDRLSRCR
jgi:hypothetical protein